MVFLQASRDVAGGKPGARGGTVADWLFGGSGAAAVDSMPGGTR